MSGPHNSRKNKIDYSAVSTFQTRALRESMANFRAVLATICGQNEQFRVDPAHWLEDYALPGAKIRFGGAYTLNGPKSWVQRQAAALRPHSVDRVRRIQIDESMLRAPVLLFRQGERLKHTLPTEKVSLIRRPPIFCFH